jgi:hypothetical protein
MSEQLVRGYMIFSTRTYLEKTYDADTRVKILEKITPEARNVITSVDSITWYPIDPLCQMLREIALHHQRSDGKVREALSDIGWNIAEMATNTFLKIVMKVIGPSPAMFQAKLPTLWTRDHQFGVLKAHVFDTNTKVMKTSLTDIAGYDFIGPVGAGYHRYALENVFKFKNARINFDWKIEEPGPRDVHFACTWD